MLTITPGTALRRRTALATVCTPMFLVLLDVLVANVAMPTIGRRMGVAEAHWSGLVTAYTVPLALGLLPGGGVTDRWGARSVLLVGLAGFGTGSLTCALAPSWSVLLAGRAAQGLGAALALPASLAALIGLWTHEPERSRALGAWSGVSALATALGPALGGLLLACGSWRLVFAVNVPLCLLAGWGTVLLPPPRRARTSGRAQARARSLTGSTAAGWLMTVVGNGTLTSVTLYLRDDAGLAVLPASAVLLVATVPFAALGPSSGRAMARFGRRRTALAGLLVAVAALCCGAGILAVAVPAAVVAVLLGIGVGLGLITAPIVGEAMQAIPGRPGLAAGVNNTARQLGTSAGVTGATARMASPLGLRWVVLVAALVWTVSAAVVAATFDGPRSAD